MTVPPAPLTTAQLGYLARTWSFKYLASSRLSSFLTLNLELQHHHGPMWVNARGNDGVKEFLRTELGI